MERFSTKGRWWLPEKPGNSIAGILVFDPAGRSKLELFGNFDKGHRWISENTKESIILGVGEKGQAITLVDCIVINMRNAFGQCVWQASSYYPNIIIQGHHFKCAKKIALGKLWLKYYGLEEWASTGRNLGTISADEFDYNRSDKDDIIVAIDGFELNILRGYSYYRDGKRLFSAKQDAYISIVPDSPWELEEIFSRIFDLQVFLSLAMGTSTWPMSIEASNPSEPTRLISLHYVTVANFCETEKMYNMYFTLESMRTKIDSCLRQWFAKSRKLAPVLFLYHQTISKKMTLSDEFLDYTKAMEAYHRQMHDKTYVDDKEFEKILEELKGSVLKDVDEKLKQSILNSLKYANRFSLRSRLKDIRDYYHPRYSDDIFKDFDHFVNRIVELRNYLTHLDRKGENTGAQNGFPLYYMCERLRHILELCLLSELGLKDDELQALIKKSLETRPLL